MSNMREPVICACCATAIAEWQRDVLVVLSKHHGDRHPNIITVEMFLDRMTPDQLDMLARQIMRRTERGMVA